MDKDVCSSWYKQTKFFLTLIKRLILIFNFTKNSRFVLKFSKKNELFFIKEDFFLFNLSCNYFGRIRKYLELKLFHRLSHRILPYIFDFKL